MITSQRTHACARVRPHTTLATLPAWPLFNCSVVAAFECLVTRATYLMSALASRPQPAPFRAFFDEAINSGGALVARDAREGQIIGSSRFHAYDEA